MCCAIPEVRTKITIFADDDVFWPTKLLDWILAPFEDEHMGGVGTSQRLRRETRPTIWNFLGACYLERRNFDIGACTHVDGGLPCLSGRTVAYRTAILQKGDFMYGFQNEMWRSYQLNADDDNFITRWMVSHGWKTHVQYHKEAEVRTTLEDNQKFIRQCLRWSRSNWRSNITSMFVEGHVWWRQPWSTYAVQQTTLTGWSLPVDATLLYLCLRATENWQSRYREYALFLQIAWMLGSKFVKLFGHFIRYPEDVVLFPVYVLFGYFHCFIKLYAMFTLSETAWGSREGADDHDILRMMRPPAYTEKATTSRTYAQSPLRF
ncbi:MAG: Type 2 glycosyltransferase [Bathelium mastoideum]|nr:MAG: Type 2 glycosyltransferase [Bathelium mastoideum]